MDRVTMTERVVEAAPPDKRAVSAAGMLHALGVLLPGTILFITMATLTWHAAMPLTNPDTYFHLRFGHEFLDGGWTPWDPGSVSSFGTNDWVPTQWLPQVVMAQIEDWLGLAGVAWFQGFLHLALCVTFWVVARRWSTPLVSATIVATALMASSLGLSMRPQVISYLLVAVTTAAWLRTREDGRVRWWLVPMTWVWAMCHGMWPVSIVIGVVAVVAIAADRAVPRRRLLALAAVPLGCAVAAALTPVGPRLFPAVLLVGGRGQYFGEWKPLDFTSVVGVSLLVLIAAVAVRMVRRGSVSTWTDIAFVGLTVGWALYSTRTVAVAAAMLVPITAHVYSGWPRPASPPGRRETGAVLALAAAFLALLAVVVPRTADAPPDEPSWASAVDDLPAGTVVLNDWGQGGWMIWRWPELDFVSNGYGDIFTDAELDRNLRLDAAGTGWVTDAQRTGAAYALVEPGTKLAYGLELMDWTVLHRSKDLVLMEPPPDWDDR